MVAMQKAEQPDTEVLPAELFGSMALVSIPTCILTPFADRPILRLWPQGTR